MLQKSWNRIQEYPEECIVDFKMLQMKLLECANFGAIGSIGSIGRVSKTIAVHLEPEGIHCGTDFYTI